MGEWRHTISPKIPGTELEIWTNSGQVRSVIPNPDWYGFIFTDCTHPMQNSLCSEDIIRAWRLK